MSASTSAATSSKRTDRRTDNGNPHEAGIPREHADIYAEAVRRGGTLVTVRTEDAFSDRVSDILNRHSPVDIEERAESWRQAGWRGFDERAEPYAGSFSPERPATPERPLRTRL